MAKTLRPFDREQMLLMPPSLRDWVSAVTRLSPLAGLVLVYPGRLQDLIGFGLFALALALQALGRRGTAR